MPRWNSQSIYDTIMGLVDGGSHAYEDLHDLLDEIRTGRITVTCSEAQVVLRSDRPASPLVAALNALRRTAGNPRLTDIAAFAHVSTASMSRLFAGNRRPSWPVVKLVIEYLDGDPDEFLPLWIQSRAPDVEDDEIT